MSKIFPDTGLSNIIDLKGIGQSYDGGENWIIKDLEFIVEDTRAVCCYTRYVWIW